MISRIENKKICLFASGSSLLNHNINFEEYDTVIGINRCYLTPEIKYVDILFHNSSGKDVMQCCDPKSQKIFRENKMKIVFTPGYDMAPSYHRLVKTQPDKFSVNRKLLPNAVKFFIKEGVLETGKLLTGVGILWYLTNEYNIKQLDLYGFDFFQNDSDLYYNKNIIDRRKGSDGHNISQNKKVFEWIVNKYPYINHYK
tara:strand:+ start:56 stop:652 length:597 start_codon:yes stop_codon:yes gene_type:complete